MEAKRRLRPLKIELWPRRGAHSIKTTKQKENNRKKLIFFLLQMESSKKKITKIPCIVFFVTTWFLQSAGALHQGCQYCLDVCPFSGTWTHFSSGSEAMSAVHVMTLHHVM